MSTKRLTNILSLMLLLLLSGALLVACGGDDEDLGVDDAGVADSPFTGADVNADAFVDEDEFNAFLGDNEAGFAEDDVELFEQHDDDGDSLLAEDEFGTMLEEGPGAALDTIEGEPFDEFDANDDGFLNEEEFGDFLLGTELDFGPDDADLFELYDLDDNSLIDEDEFGQMLDTLG